MKKTNSLLHATGCRRCPYEIDLHQTTYDGPIGLVTSSPMTALSAQYELKGVRRPPLPPARNKSEGRYEDACSIVLWFDQELPTFNRFLMFEDENSGYSSVPMSACYTPWPACIPVKSGDRLVAFLEGRDAPLACAIAAHENPGHLFNNRSLTNFRIRLLAAEAYKCLRDVMSNDNNASWKQLEELNGTIEYLTNATAFLDELFANTIAHIKLRWDASRALDEASRVAMQNRAEQDNEPLWPGWDIPKKPSRRRLAAMEKRFIGAAKENFGQAFAQIYGRLIKISDYLGHRPIQLLLKHAQESGYHARNGFEMLTTGVSLLEQLTKSPADLPPEIKDIRDEQWVALFYAHLPGFKEVFEIMGNLYDNIESQLDTCEREWDEIGSVSGANPIRGARISASKTPKLIVYPLLHTLLTDDKLPRGSVVYIHGDPEQRDTENTEEFSGFEGLCFVRLLRMPRENESLPFSQARLAPHVFGLKNLMGSGILRDIKEMIVLETLRVMVENRQGPWCPERSIPWATIKDGTFRPLRQNECCGRREQLKRLWEAGQRAGFSEETWKKPLECAHCSVVPPI